MGQELQTMERGGDGRLTGARGLTELQQVVMTTFAVNGSITETAKIVGCTAPVASQIMRLAHVQSALHGECQQLLKRAAPIAIETLTMLASDKDIRRTRLGLDASKVILDRAGHGSQSASDSRPGDKRDLSDLSPGELATFIQDGQAALARKVAVDVDGTVSTPASDLDPT